LIVPKVSASDVEKDAADASVRTMEKTVKPISERPRRIVKRYRIASFYDTRDSRYDVTLLRSPTWFAAGEDVQIIDNATKEDKTEVTLASYISEELKSQPRSVPLGTLRDLIHQRGRGCCRSCATGHRPAHPGYGRKTGRARRFAEKGDKARRQGRQGRRQATDKEKAEPKAYSLRASSRRRSRRLESRKFPGIQRRIRSSYRCCNCPVFSTSPAPASTSRRCPAAVRLRFGLSLFGRLVGGLVALVGGLVALLGQKRRARPLSVRTRDEPADGPVAQLRQQPSPRW